MKRLIVLILFSLLLLSCEKSPLENTPIPAEPLIPNDTLADSISIENQSYAQEIFTLINEHRAQQGLQLLQWSPTIEQLCYDHSSAMADSTVPFGHEGFQEERADIIWATLGGNGVAENVAMGYRTSETVIEGWLTSPSHKENIEGNYTYTGIGIAYSSDGTPYYTQIFLSL